MPLRGETIGTAFVRLMVDGDELPESVRRELRRATPEMEKVGEEHSRAYNEGFSAQQKKDKNVEKSLTANIQRAFAKMDADADFFSKGFGKRLATNIDRELKKSYPQFSKSSERLSRIISDGILKDFARTGNFNLNLRKRLLDAVQEAGSDNRWDRLSTKIDKVGDHFGKAFGKGSRNNFLNFIGSAMGGLVDLGQVLPKTIKKVQDISTAFREGFTGAGGGLKGLIGGVSGAGEVVGPLLKSLPALVIAVAIVVTALGALSVVISGVTAAVVALSGALAFAAVGAIAPLVGLIAPLGLALAALVIGFAGMGKAARKAFVHDIKPLADEFRSLRKLVQGKLLAHVSDQAKELAPTIKRLKPVLGATATAISGMFTSFIKGLNSKGFRTFLATLQTFVPKALGSLGRTFANTFVGLGGVFRALEPFTLSFLHSIERISGRFDRFTNSAKGQKGLTDFFKRASDSAGKLWGLVKAVAGVVGTLLSGGQPTGNSLIESLTTNVQKFNDFLTQNPGKLQDWFKEGGSIARDIGNIVVAIGKVIGQLDDPTNRSIVHGFFVSMAAAASILGPVINAINYQLRAIATAVSFVKDHWAGAWKQIKIAALDVVLFFADFQVKVSTALANAFGGLPFIGKGFKDAEVKAREFRDKINEELASIRDEHVNVSIAISSVQGVKGLSNQAKAKILDIALSRAEFGGPAFPGVPMLVGEGGPEVFVPSRTGTIVPNHDPAVQQFLASAGSQTTSNTNIRNGKSIDASGWTIVTPTEDPRRVADEVVNRLAGATL